MFTVVLFQPEIPPNTGNVIRLCANTGCELHLVKPMGFPLEDAKLRRAGLDYHEYARVVVHEDWDACLRALQGRRIFAATTKGATRHDRISYQPGDVFLFGPESRGLPQDVLAALPAQQRIRLPMRPESRSLNLSNAVAVTVFEAWRQLGFDGGV
ncbi:tRNA (uridine(34)/cytosine(34)/5-carboxymethylaminomethyluridine(34)-2'-O)-methyltransferase TrmL [Chromobacterium piscinae]|uniref:tRNA (cytidine(34)-2'-O)-methyltransferase n=1 Tax=Chromobacterium piscinae TaxID=686831 RepID=A0ABV0H545_9NEIS|nr:tRNA (uridine(34)/cytosine(34)/5-carboxymethylaminomethyluridine(34)-2'-O)-methyltransferase TrmL [Chromobacterium piscinae]MBX9297153.1 tRNA (uridine(34)/cytosine(34)/5-carboxymethylaminomethyluridine(34)-2'-O)-methyltransferase TrmL [Chromobacterium vaccinii]MBX9349423.1 tRNA (uridine(34)/cytosine(34)/5-carboxymethylaminomethyluridine(34)-2'-O)-methyltransferase TrmL [Chromobacterium vaccinii]MBX9358144.1 tRNA (uridine(34)/cytosine(34)/5-carboxymethylaminomethyluridine(34)-2'-O)-methyltrans